MSTFGGIFGGHFWGTRTFSAVFTLYLLICFRVLESTRGDIIADNKHNRRGRRLQKVAVEELLAAMMIFYVEKD